MEARGACGGSGCTPRRTRRSERRTAAESAHRGRLGGFALPLHTPPGADLSCAQPTAGEFPMLPASDLSEILANLSALNLQPNTTAQILAAVLAPLLRSSDSDPPPGLEPPSKPSRRPRVRPRRATRRKKPKHQAAAAAAVQNERSDRDAPRQRAIAALRTNPDATPSEIAKVAKCSRSTVVNARETLAAEARKQARKLRENPVLAKQTERRQR